MNEDKKPLYDIESNWEKLPKESNIFRHIYKYKEEEGVYRLIDMVNRSVFFSDADRITIERVIDINKKIDHERKETIWLLAIAVMNDIKPVTFPYVREKLTIYVEDLGEMLGILYYKDDTEDKNIIPVKQFFKTAKKMRTIDDFVPISPEDYFKYRNRKENLDVDNGPKKTADGEH